MSLRRSRNEAMRSGGHAATLLDCANRRIHLATAAAKNVNRRPVALCVDKFLKLGLEEVEIVNTEMLEGTLNEPAKVTISYDQKLDLQALPATTPNYAPSPNQHPSHLRDYEHKRLGRVSLLAGLDRHAGPVIETGSDTHNSGGFIEFLNKFDDARRLQAGVD